MVWGVSTMLELPLCGGVYGDVGGDVRGGGMIAANRPRPDVVSTIGHPARGGVVTGWRHG
tara:strand:+ start:215 stop:394 length:180 start_codon:yes stop_codon:yes gene_type:complete